MFSKRDYDILMELLNNEEITIEYICDKYNVSKRTIQYNINNINYYLKKYNLSKISINNSKIKSVKEDIEKLIEIVNSTEYISKEDRLKLISIYGAFSKNGINVTSLSKELGISRNTLKSEMNMLEEEFIYVHSKGYYLSASIDEKVIILESVLKNMRLKKYIFEVIDKDIFAKVEAFLKDVSKEIKLNINEEIYTKLTSHIYCYIYFDEKVDLIASFNVSEEYESMKRIYLKYFSKTCCMNKIIDSLVMLSLNNNLNYWVDENFLFKKLVKRVSDQIDIDLTEDKILHDFLFSHIKVSIYRLKNNLSLHNRTYEKLVWQDDPLIAIVKNSLTEIEDIFNIKFTSIEISLITYHFKASIERMNTENRKKVILVCGLGYGTSRLVEYSLKDKFDIDIVDVLPAYMINDDIVNNKNVDYILTTVDLEYPSIKINPTLDDENFEKLKQLGIKRKKERILIDEFLDEFEEIANFDRNKAKNFLLNKYSHIFSSRYKDNYSLKVYLDEKRVIFKDRVENLYEAINILGNNLEQLLSINAEYTKEMIQLIDKFGPYIVIEDGIALPHARGEKNVLRNDLSVLILKEPIILENGKKIKILFCFCSVDDKSHLDMLSDIYKLIINKSFLSDIEDIKTYTQLISYLDQKIY